MKISHRNGSSGSASLVGAVMLGGLFAVALPAAAQVSPGTIDQAGTAAGGVLGQTGQTVGQVGGAVGDAAGNVVGGLQPTLQPVGQGVGNALNNLTQPDTVASLLEFLAGVIPNHIEAHVNLDSLRVEKLTVDVRGVDLRNLRVDLLVANSRNAGQVRPALGPGSRSGAMGRPGAMGGPGGMMGRPGGMGSGSAMGGTGDTGSTSGWNPGGVQLPGETPIEGSSARPR